MSEKGDLPEIILSSKFQNLADAQNELKFRQKYLNYPNFEYFIVMVIK